YERYLRNLTPKSIKSVETSFNRAIRKFLDYLPKDFNEEIVEQELNKGKNKKEGGEGSRY
ncbi:31718_t:CDS:1, partial [Racocetra persica]